MTPIVIAVIVGEEGVGMQKGLELLCPRRIIAYANRKLVLIYLDYNTTWQESKRFPVFFFAVSEIILIFDPSLLSWHVSSALVLSAGSIAISNTSSVYD